MFFSLERCVGRTRTPPPPPFQSAAFQAYQTECTEGVRSQLWTSWAPKSVEIFNRIPPIFINGDAEAYYRSIATLQVHTGVMMQL